MTSAMMTGLSGEPKAAGVGVKVGMAVGYTGSGVAVVKSCERVGTGLTPTPQAVIASNPSRTKPRNDLRMSGISEFYLISTVALQGYVKIERKSGGKDGNYPCEG